PNTSASANKLVSSTSNLAPSCVRPTTPSIRPNPLSGSSLLSVLSLTAPWNQLRTPLRHFWRIFRGYFRRDFLALLRGCRGFLAGLRYRGGLAPPLRLGRGGGRFADDFSREDAGHKKFRSMVIKINGRALGIRGCDNAQTVYPVLDGLPFLHHLHNFLLNFTRVDSYIPRSLLGRSPRSRGPRQSTG